MTKDLITISEIVREHNIPYSTINHYTVMGLLTVVGKKKQMRLYGKAEIRERLARISELKNMGYPLQLIKKELGK